MIDEAATQAIVIRDAIYSRIEGLTGRFKTLRKVPMPALQLDDLPAASIFVLLEDENSDGDPNASYLKYKNDVTIGISVARAFDDPVYLDGKLDFDISMIKSILLTDDSFTARRAGGLFEAVPRMKRTWVFAQEAEAFYAELRLEMTFTYRESFMPPVRDPFQVVDVVVPKPETNAEQIEAIYNLPGDTT